MPVTDRFGVWKPADNGTRVKNSSTGKADRKRTVIINEPSVGNIPAGCDQAVQP